MDIRTYASKHRSTDTNIPVAKYAASKEIGLHAVITKLSPLVVIMMTKIFSIVM